MARNAKPKRAIKAVYPFIDFGLDTYRIRLGALKSKDTEYGDPCVLVDDAGALYVACIHQTDDGERMSLLLDNADSNTPTPFMIKGIRQGCLYGDYDENEPDTPAKSHNPGQPGNRKRPYPVLSITRSK